ncbi:transcription factor grauzone [Ceratitis capitata]|uniref:transcription factor grauzone n=1 Tax=Ceratitis capitata TaxID=7213 RepID=UPI000329C5A1|nr:transcription factor grauzone [Ceratitis capitata]
MFDKSSCILCLENVDISDDHINMDSEEEQSANAREIINQHFKEELSMMLILTNKIVCNQCWELVQTFHEFYVRVQNAHIAATNTLKSLQEMEIPVTEIKIEPYAVDELASPTKRQRGRPRRQKEDKRAVEHVPISLKECSVRMEPLILPINTNNSGDIQLDQNVQNLEIKYEVVSNELMDDTHHIPQSDNGSESKSILTDSSLLHPVDPPLILKKKIVHKKRGLKRKRIESKPKLKPYDNKPRHKTSEYDDYIAQHFKLSCFLCQKSLENFTVLKVHYREQHETNGYVKCCGKKLLRRSVLVDHIHFHNDPEFFKCQQCEKLLSDRHGLEKHVQFFHGSRERIYQCDICSKSFFRREVLARHYQLHAPEEEKQVKCTECEKTFCSEYIMTQHLRLVHQHMYSKICDICGKSFRGNDALRRHQEEHSGLPRSRIKCDLCDAQLTTKYGLARHMKVMHTVEYQTPQTCPICSKVSPTLRAHQNHFKYMHATERKHACKLCDKAFKRLKGLREHMASHTGDVLYTCTFCSQTFNSNANMYAHRKRKHPKEWAEKCAKK